MSTLSEILGKSFKGTTIEDPLLEPFFIARYDTGGFAVIRKIAGPGDKLRIRVHNYPSTFLGCLNTIAQEKLNNGKEYQSVQDYISDWKSIVGSIHNLYKDWNVEQI